MDFYLGTHKAGWLAELDVPLFVSRRTLAPRRSLPQARTGWALDSGGFTELGLHGRWVTSEAEYLEDVARFRDGIGQLEWAAPMDWMCEPSMLARTGLSVAAHQERTVENYLRLRGSGLPFIPVLQGWTLGDYGRCAALYRSAGVDLTAGRVGLGSVCRRQRTSEVLEIALWLRGQGIAAHGFGVKTGGLRRYGDLLASADSMAWSYDARRATALPGCTHLKCSNCPRWALRWRARVLARLATQQQHLRLTG